MSWASGSCRDPIRAGPRAHRHAPATPPVVPRRSALSTLDDAMSVIEQLVDQIEARFADAEREMGDPEVITDRDRYAAAGRTYRQLEPAAKLGAIIEAITYCPMKNKSTSRRVCCELELPVVRSSRVSCGQAK